MEQMRQVYIRKHLTMTVFATPSQQVTALHSSMNKAFLVQKSNWNSTFCKMAVMLQYRVETAL